jgi:hypothetical protein
MKIRLDIKVFSEISRLAFIDFSRDWNSFSFSVRGVQVHPLDMSSSSASNILLGCGEILKMTAINYLKIR